MTSYYSLAEEGYRNRKVRDAVVKLILELRNVPRGQPTTNVTLVSKAQVDLLAVVEEYALGKIG